MANTSGVLEPTTNTLVAEIVPPGSQVMDRLTKPTTYAGACIPSFWRVELKDGPIVFAYRLEQRRYVELGAPGPESN